MAEIHLEKRRSGMGLVWILVLLLIALIVWWVWAASEEDVAASPGPQLSAVSAPAPFPPETSAESHSLGGRLPFATRT